MTIDRRVPPPFPNTPDYANHSTTKAIEYLSQPAKTLAKELVSPRYRDYPPIEMFSFPQPPQTPDGPQSQPQPSQRLDVTLSISNRPCINSLWCNT